MSWSLGEAQALAVKAARGAGLPWGLAEEAGMALRWLEARGLPGAEALAQLLSKPPGAAPSVTGEPPESPICPIRLGAALLDFPGADPGDYGDVLAPILLIPFLALSGRSGNLIWSGARAEIAAGEVTLTGPNLVTTHAQTSFTSADFSEPRTRAIESPDLQPSTGASAPDRARPSPREGANAPPGSGASLRAQAATFQPAGSPIPAPDSPKPPSDSPRRTRVLEAAAPHMAILATLAARTYAPATEASRAGAGAGVSDND